MGLLAYWDIRGFAEPIRLMLEYSDQSYEEKKYSTGGPPDFKRTMWTDVKEVRKKYSFESFINRCLYTKF